MSSVPDNVYNETRNARKIIVVALGFLGDSVHLIPALWALSRNYPRAELHVLTTPLGGEVIKLVPCVNRRWCVARNPKQSNWRKEWTTLRALRAERFELAINFSGANRPVIWTALTGAACRVASHGPRHHFWYPWLISNWVPRQPPGMPIARQHLNILAACGLDAGAPRWEFRVPDEARQKAKALVAEGAIHLSICASTPLKEWPLQNWIELAKRLLAANERLLLVATGSSSSREIEKLESFARTVGHRRLTTLTGLSIAELAAVVESCRLHVGADSGVLHLAVALGLPTVSLFRDYHDASAWAPAGARHRVFQVPCVCVNQKAQPCATMQRADCLAKLEVGQIEAAVREQWDSAPANEAANNKLA